MLTTNEAAERLHLSRSRILKLIAAFRLNAVKHGRDWQIDPADLAAFAKIERRPGKPRKEKGQ
jgi:excisionase family DNA binding protein